MQDIVFSLFACKGTNKRAECKKKDEVFPLACSSGSTFDEVRGTSRMQKERRRFSFGILERKYLRRSHLAFPPMGSWEKYSLTCSFVLAFSASDATCLALVLYKIVQTMPRVTASCVTRGSAQSHVSRGALSLDGEGRCVCGRKKSPVVRE